MTPTAPYPTRGPSAFLAVLSMLATVGLFCAGGCAPPGSAPLAASPGRSVPAGPMPRVEVEAVTGLSAAEVRARYAPVAPRVAECTPGKGGLLEVRIGHTDDATHLSLEPGSAAVGSGRCVLETLSTVDVDDVPSRASPGDRPSGFSALLRIQW